MPPGRNSDVAPPPRGASAPRTVIAITHTAAEGTLVYGTTRGDGTKHVLGPAGFRWFRSVEAWGIVRSRDRPADRARIERVADQLRSTGFTVSVAIDDTTRSAAAIEADTASRRRDRAEKLASKAQRGAATAEQAWQAAQAAADRLPPAGEPIKVGHHSQGRHQTAIARAQTAMARAVAATAKAENDKRRAQAAAAAEAHRQSPSAVKRRIERLEALQRRDERARDGSRRTVCTATGTVEHRLPATGQYRERIVARIADRQAQIDYWQGVYAAQLSEGIAQDFSRASITCGDTICYRGRWYPVVRVNAKTVTVELASGTSTIRYHQISQHRRGAAEAGGGHHGRLVPDD